MKLSLIIFFTLNISLAYAQATICTNQLDTAAVISIAKSKSAYWTKTGNILPEFSSTAKIAHGLFNQVNQNSHEKVNANRPMAVPKYIAYYW